VAQGTLLLSPHSDDAVMSAFGILKRRLLPAPVTLLTVFTLTNYFVRYGRARPNLRVLGYLLPRPTEVLHALRRNAGRFGTNPLGIARKLIDMEEPYKISRVRLLEDVGFSRRMGLKFRYVILGDSQIRRGRPIMDPGWLLTNEQDTLDAVYRAVDNLVLRLNIQVIAVNWPFGDKQHVDHRMVSECATRIAEDRGVKLLYLDDQPYSRRPLRVTKNAVGSTYAPMTVSLSTEEMKSKLRAMSLYWSQMVPEYVQAVLRPAPGSLGNAYTETLWEPLQRSD